MSAHSDPSGDRNAAAEKPNASSHRLADVLLSECTQAQAKLGSRKATLDLAANLLTGQSPSATGSDTTDSDTEDSGGDPARPPADEIVLAPKDNAGDVEDFEETLTSRAVYEALLARERLGSTALGEGVAIPHCRLAGMTGIRAALLTLDQGVDFDAPDGNPVDLLCCLIVGEEEQDHHLKLLSQLAQIFSDAGKRRALRAEKTTDGLYRQLLAFAPDSDRDAAQDATQ